VSHSSSSGHHLPVSHGSSAGSRRSSIAAVAAGPPTDLSAGRGRLAVFVSGGGSNLKAIHAACLDGRVNADVVVSRPSRCGGAMYCTGCR
jgi:phosphoribosylglycinamide formyltransferase